MLRFHGHRGDQEGEGENFDFDNLSGSDEDNVPDWPVCRGCCTQNTATTPSQPVAQEINSVVPTPTSSLPRAMFTMFSISLISNLQRSLSASYASMFFAHLLTFSFLKLSKKN